MTLKIKTDFPIERLNLGDELKLVRDKLSKIDFTKPGIHILKVQPSVGKTYAIKELTNRLNSYLVVTSSHKLLGEEYQLKGAKHWKGVNREKMCSEYDKIKSKYDLGIPIRTLCKFQGCKISNCPYWKQFNTKKAVAPFEYLQTNRVEYKSYNKKGDFKFGVVIVDESMNRLKTLKFNETELIEAMDTIQRYSPNQKLEKEFVNFLANPNYYDFEDFLSAYGMDLYRAKIAAINAALKNKKKPDASKISRLDVIGLRKILYYKAIHGVESYSESLFYQVFDLVRQGIPIIILDATFDEKQMQVVLGKYQKEETKIPRTILLKKNLEPLDAMKITIYESSLEDKNQVIRKMDKDNLYYRKAFFKDKGQITPHGESLIKKFRERIQAVKRKHKTVGIITYKSLASHFQDLGPTDYLGNLRGSNKIKDVDVLFIIGTPVYPPNEIIKRYNGLTLADLDDSEVKRLIYKQIKGKYYYFDTETDEFVNQPPYDSLIRPQIDIPTLLNKYLAGDKDDINDLDKKKPVPLMDKDFNKYLDVDILLLLSKSKEKIAESYYPLYEFDYNQTENEKYQAVHRARLFNHNKPVFIFGDVPQKIREEFMVIELDKKETADFFYEEFFGVYPIPLFKAINHLIILNPSFKSSEIAKKLRLYKSNDKKTGYNTKFVTYATSTNLAEATKVFEKIDSAIKEGYKTVNEIRKVNSGLKIEDSIIEDCIHYAESGKFIILPKS